MDLFCILDGHPAYYFIPITSFVYLSRVDHYHQDQWLRKIERKKEKRKKERNREGRKEERKTLFV